MTLRSKIALEFILGLSVFIVLGLFAFFSLLRISDVSRQVEKQSIETSRSGALRSEVLKYLVINDFVISGDLKRVHYLENIGFAIRESLKLEKDASLRFKVYRAKLRVFLDSIDVESKKLLKLDDPIKSEEGNRITEKIDGLARQLILLVETESDQARNRLENLFADQKGIIYQSQIYFILILVFLVIGGISSRYMFLKNIQKRLDETRAAAKKIADGTFQTRLPALKDDEISHLQSSINLMASQLEKSRKVLVDYNKNLEIKIKERTDELKRIHLKLLQKEKLAQMGQLSAAIAHEIRNPLTIALGTIQLIRTESELGNSLRADVESIEKEIRRCNHTVEELLKLSRDVDLTMNPSALEPLINETIERVVKVENPPEINFKVFCWVKEPFYIDAFKIQMVLKNLIQNAIEAMNGKGVITIIADIETVAEKQNNGEGGYVKISVADTGVGIEGMDHNEVFTPFYTTKKGGTGLGLALSHQIVMAHGGWIDAADQHPHGTVFTIHLPYKVENDGN